MSFHRWLRSNSEYHLMVDAQDRMARQLGFNPPPGPRGLSERFWRQIFVPVFRAMPEGLRTGMIQALPGSHRQAWPKRALRESKSK